MNAAPAPARHEGRWAIYASYLIVMGMLACFAATAIHLAQWFFPAWDARGLALVCALVAVEAVVSYWLIKYLPSAQMQVGYYRLSEWLILLAVLKIFTEARPGMDNLLRNVLMWPTDFPSNLLTGAFLLNVLLAFVVWLTSTLFANDLFLLETEEAVRLDERIQAAPMRDLIVRRFLRLGIVVVFMAGLVLQPGAGETPPGGVVPTVVLFFVLGLALVSLTKYVNLYTHWQHDRVSVPASVPQRWVLYSLAILAFLVAASVWLPTNYGLGFLESLRGMIGLLYELVGFLFAIFLYVLAIIFRFFMRLLPAPETSEDEPVGEPSLPDMLGSSANAPQEIWKSIFFWAVLLTLLFVLLRQYLAFNRDLAAELRRFRPLRWLADAWQRFKASVSKANKAVGSLIQGGLQRLRSLRAGAAETGEWDYVSLRRLSPRQKVIFYYLSLVRRSTEAGLPRQDGQTPYEYARTLASGLEQGREDVDALTESFVEARYSRHAIPAERAGLIQSAWDGLRRVLNQVRKRRREERAGRDD